MRKQFKEMAENLKYWLSNEPRETVNLFLYVLAAMPGGEELQDLGFDQFQLGWAEVELLEDMLRAINTQDDVREIINLLLNEDEQ
ncbi:MAG: hypothetical protein IRZ03_18930 [Acidobacterium ailaaui]|nr:hypothetical protein [Pseudacidobacterium ailaaui]